MQPLDSQLENSWYWAEGQGIIFGSPAPATMEQAELFEKAAQKVATSKNPSLPFRIMHCQLCRPTNEWPLIEDHQIYLRTLNNKDEGILNIPTDPLNIPKDRPPESEFLLKDAHQLTSLYNTEAWSLYCYWISLNTENILLTIPLEAMELYTLEAALKDLVHEQKSAWLKKNENSCSEALLKIRAAKKEGTDPFESEKQLMRARMEIQKSLQMRLPILNKIDHLIGNESSGYPYLLPLKQQSHLLSLLLNYSLGNEECQKLSWEQQLMLIQLLNESLGVCTALHCDTGLERTQLAFAVIRDKGHKN